MNPLAKNAVFAVGVTGGIAAGKSKTTSAFEELGVGILDADDLARRLTTENTAIYQAICQRFGSTVVLADGVLNRARLRELVFADSTHKLWLESQIHPVVNAEIQHRLRQPSQSPYRILVSPLLFETEQYLWVDRILVVDVCESVQRARALSRDGCTLETLEGIMAAQWPRDRRLAMADDVLDNSGPWQSTQERIYQLHQSYLQLAQHDR